MFSNFDNQRGYSIIELLVAAGISGFLTLALAGIMASSKKNYDVTEATTTVQENARFAMKTLAYDLRLAGFYGCAGRVPTSGSEPIAGVTATGNQLVSGKGDEITISFADSSSGVVENKAPANQGDLTVIFSVNGDLPEPWAAGDEIVISDCANAEIATIGSVTFASGSMILVLTNGLSNFYSDGITAMRYRERNYKVEYLLKDDGDDSSTPALFMYEGANPRVEVASGVEFVRFLYGVDDYQTADADTLPEYYATWTEYQDSLTAGGGGKVVSVQVGLLVRSISSANPNADKSATHHATESGRTNFQVLDIDTDNASVGSANGLSTALVTDGVTRQAFSTTLAIRNATR